MKEVAVNKTNNPPLVWLALHTINAHLEIRLVLYTPTYIIMISSCGKLLSANQVQWRYKRKQLNPIRDKTIMDWTFKFLLGKFLHTCLAVITLFHYDIYFFHPIPRWIIWNASLRPLFICTWSDPCTTTRGLLWNYPHPPPITFVIIPVCFFCITKLFLLLVFIIIIITLSIFKIS